MNALQEIRSCAARLNRCADFPAKRWQEVAIKDITWSRRRDCPGATRSVQWQATKQARTVIQICGEPVRKGYLVLSGELFILRSNPCGYWLENPRTDQQIEIFYDGVHRATPVFVKGGTR